MDFNVFIKSNAKNAFKKEIKAYAKYKDGREYPLNYILFKKVNAQTIVEMFERLKDIEEQSSLMENFGFKPSQKIDLGDIEYIDFYKFPINLEKWTNTIYRDNWRSKLKESLSLIPGMPGEAEETQ